MLHALRDNEELPRLEVDFAVPRLDRQLAVNNEEQLVGVLEGVPDELALELHDFDVVVVQARHHLW